MERKFRNFATWFMASCWRKRQKKPLSAESGEVRNSWWMFILDAFRVLCKDGDEIVECLRAMDYLIGLLKIRVRRGINLVVRDTLSSDPYVVITMGEQAC
ncbi:Protein C2-DOMAIN ABA-RELATED 7 [Camellia lanceoleosa]|uniref:Protein C2-DOMAIN ABA-RELATED 7 n=1 Tax=Camellia lanceoleosa TaxID=1840588 RepID=A0ACC0G287_9ERIC|nr:Protein C2-DOMAIN ABA-RELATED 7 [Camellia lanceoleosa]